MLKYQPPPKPRRVGNHVVAQSSGAKPYGSARRWRAAGGTAADADVRCCAWPRCCCCRSWGRVPPSDDAADIDDYVYQIVFFDGSTEWELLAERIDPKIERLLMWLGACEVLDMCGNQVVAFGQVLYLVQEYELSCRTPGAWFAELDVYCIASEERVTIRFRLAKEHFAKDNSLAANSKKLSYLYITDGSLDQRTNR